MGLKWTWLEYYHEQAVPILIVENKRLQCDGMFWTTDVYGMQQYPRDRYPKGRPELAEMEAHEVVPGKHHGVHDEVYFGKKHVQPPVPEHFKTAEMKSV